MAHIGYRRCSTDEDKQNVDRQLQNITLDKVYIEYASGKNEEGRPVYLQMLSTLVKGDHVYFNELSRAGRNTAQLLSTIDTLLAKGVTIHFLTEGYVLEDHSDTNPMQKALTRVIITVVSACNELFLAQTSIAIKQGLEEAKRRGVKLGAASDTYQQKLAQGKINHVSKHTSSAAAEYWEQHRPQIEHIITMMKNSKTKLTFANICSNLNKMDITSREGKVLSPAQTSRILDKLNISRV